MDIKKIVPQELIWAEVTSDLQLMFEQKNNLGSDSPYGRMTDIEFANDRKKRTMANIPGWFGWDGSYGSILATRIAKKTGYKTTQSDISLLMSKDDSTYVNAAIQAAIDIYLDNIIISLSAAALGRKGGSVKSDRKAKASAENGKKGGRPAKIELGKEKYIIHNGVRYRGIVTEIRNYEFSIKTNTGAILWLKTDHRLT